MRVVPTATSALSSSVPYKAGVPSALALATCATRTATDMKQVRTRCAPESREKGAGVWTRAIVPGDAEKSTAISDDRIGESAQRTGRKHRAAYTKKREDATHRQMRFREIGASSRKEKRPPARPCVLTESTTRRAKNAPSEGTLSNWYRTGGRRKRPRRAKNHSSENRTNQ